MSDPFSTIDGQIAQIKADHALQLRNISDQLIAAQLEATMQQKAAKTAIEARIEAEKRTANLQALFAVLEHVLAEAKKLDTPNAPQSEAVAAAKEQIDAAVQA